MKLIDKIASLPENCPYYTFEFFPPRTDQGFDNLLARIARLSQLNPLAISITWGAGGSTKERSSELAAISQAQFGLDTVLHLTCTNMEKGMVDQALNDAKEKGIHNILALRGDPPAGKEYWLPTDPRFQHASDLVSYIRSQSNDFCIGVAGYPDGHPDKLLTQEAELAHLRSKVLAGADFIVTQLFYNVDGFLEWVKKVRNIGITVPIIAGMMPIQNYASFLRLTALCGSKVPPEILHALELIKGDDRKVKEFGVSLAVQMIQDIVKDSDVRGFHLCTLNLEKSVQTILENLEWVGRQIEPMNRVITDDIPTVTVVSPTDSALRIKPSEAVISASGALAVNSPAPSSLIEAGKGELNKAATWDEFPNGRFGDTKSPAYGGGIDLWTSKAVKTRETVSRWASPVSKSEITTLFLSYLHSDQTKGTIEMTPFSSSMLSPESLTILPFLIGLTERDWWTVGSQPAVDGAASSDEVFGWGPHGGWIYQKSFVEFFVEKAIVDKLEDLIKGEGRGLITYYAGDCAHGFRTNVEVEGRNAVTWGVFPGHEIEQSTIIERESFLSWKAEAFDLWTQWALCFPPGSRERACLDDVTNSRWLVSVVYHDYKNPEALWKFLDGII